ncbi:uncharacterized protein Dwil_GK19084 [Drosophila willistoni]|uniref:Transcription initiation factor TFIID subunit 12 n=1 Tax=Drosophila willistoni TaxID=7260 RepID=B4MTW3_DROWI|nr:uncharacterized protein LOC6641589 [Drosophila willistoni]EDW75552.2 uncharacterized protein Dwil_GK19084 [Drosophila willistoni]
MDLNFESIEDSDISTNSASSSSTSSTAGSPNNRSSSDFFKRSEDDFVDFFVGNKDAIINKVQLMEFLKRIDPKACLDDDSTRVVTKIADIFLNDVCDRVVQLGKLRKAEPNIKDLEFILKREYNMQFPKLSINPQQK